MMMVTAVVIRSNQFDEGDFSAPASGTDSKDFSLIKAVISRTDWMQMKLKAVRSDRSGEGSPRTEI